jgi:hypothetical protein
MAGMFDSNRHYRQEKTALCEIGLLQLGFIFISYNDPIYPRFLASFRVILNHAVKSIDGMKLASIGLIRAFVVFPPEQSKL